MRKSCLVMAILVAVVLMAISISLRRCYLDRATSSPTATPQESLAPTEDTAATVNAALVSSQQSAGDGIEGLALASVRPLTTDALTIYGLTALAGRLYYAGCDGVGQCGHISRTSAVGGAADASADISLESGVTAGGLLARNGALWLWYLPGDGADRTIVTVLDPDTLVEQSSLTMEGAAAVLAASEAGPVYGVSQDQAWLYRWDDATSAPARYANRSGAHYNGCQVIEQSLVCAGTMEGGTGTLDVLDPEEFSLLARHAAGARTQGGQLATGGSWTLFGDELLFVPPEQELPVVWTYALDGASLQEYVPSLTH